MPSASHSRSTWLPLCAGLFALISTLRAEAPWKFVVIPDAMNNDVAIDDPDWYGDGLDGTFDDGTHAAWPFTLDAIAAESPDFVLVPGDLVQGRWSLDAFTDSQIANKIATDPANFGHLAGFAGTEARKQHIRWMGDRFYPDWNRMWADRGITRVLTIPGDHEFGDNDWDKSYDAGIVPVYREKYEQYRSTPPGAVAYPAFGGRTYSLVHKNLTLVGVDVFDQNEGGNVSIGVGAPHLAFVRQALENSASPHKITMAHTPILPGALTRSSSGLVLPGGAGSNLWQTFAANNVDLFLAGEVHDISMQQKDSLLQMVCGSQASNVAEFNYLVVTVHDDRLELELKLLNTTLDGPRDVAHDPYGVDPYLLRKVKLTPAQSTAGFQSAGTMVIEKAGGSRTFRSRTGMFDSSRYTVLDPGPEPADGLLVHYEFDGDLTDSAGIRNGSLLNAGAGLGTSGAKVGSGFLSLVPTGDANQVNVGFQSAGPDLDLGSGARTVAFFVRAATSLAPSTQPTMFSIGTGTGASAGQRFDLTFPVTSAPINDLRIEVNGNGTGGGDIAPIATNFADGNWHHVAVTSAASGQLGGVRLFVDGNPVGTVAAGSNPAINTAASRIVIGDSFASSTTNPLRGFRGDVDDFRVYDRVLPDGEILALSKFGPDPFINWGLLNGLSTGVNDGFDDNPSGGPFDNGLLWILGGTSPLEFQSFESLVSLTADNSTGLTLVFQRLDDSVGQADLHVAFGPDLDGLLLAGPVPTAGTNVDIGSGVLASIVDGGISDTITVVVPAGLGSPGQRLFARLLAIQR